MKSAEELYNEAISLQKEDPEKAIELFQQCLEADENYINAYNGWGNVLLDLGKLEEAREKYTRCLEMNPTYKWANYNMARSYEDTEPEKAIHFYQKATETDPKYADAFNGWGNVHLGLDQLKEAREKYEYILSSINPSYQWAYFNLGRSYSKEDPEKALASFQKATELDPSYVGAFNSWGNVLLDINRIEEAREKYEKCIELDPTYKWAIYNIGISYEKDDPEKAISYYEKAAEIDPEYADAINSWGNGLLALNRLEEAREKYTRCIELDPHYKWAYTNYYYSIAKSGEKGELTEKFRQLVEEKNTAEGYWALANLYQYTLKEYGKSLACYEKSKALGDVHDRFLDISNLYDAIGDLGKVLQVLEAAIQDHPDSIYAVHNQAHYLFKMGQYAQARRLWREVIAKYHQAFQENSDFQKDAYNYLYCGTIHFEVFGELHEAEKLYEQGLAKDEKSVRLMLAMNQLYAERDKRAVHAELSTYWKRNTHITRAAQQLTGTEKTEEDAIQLAEMYFIEEMYDEAQAIITEQLKSAPATSAWHNLQGQIWMAKDAFAKAVEAFQKALRMEPHNLGLQTNLANAFLKNKNTHQAEKAFNDILKKDPNNVDAHIGLGEIHLNRITDDKDENLLDLAEKHLLEAILLGQSDQGSRRLDLFEPKGPSKERKYKDLKLSELYYSMGYLKAKRFERNQLGFDPALLKESLRYFSLSQACDPDNLKAIASKAKISSNLKTNRKSSRFEQFGAYMIAGLAFLTFVLCQYFFYFHKHEVGKYQLEQADIQYVTSILGLSDIKNQELGNLAGVVFEDKNTLVAAVEEVLGPKALDQKKYLIDQIDLTLGEEKSHTDFLPTGYYALISFGALIFMIAGLYLPKLLKLKVGVIEIEKNSPSEVNSISLLGIQK